MFYGDSKNTTKVEQTKSAKQSFTYFCLYDSPRKILQRLQSSRKPFAEGVPAEGSHREKFLVGTIQASHQPEYTLPYSRYEHAVSPNATIILPKRFESPLMAADVSANN